MDKNQSAINCESLIQSVQSAANSLANAETDAAVATIRHCMVHGSAELVAKLKEKLGDFGSKHSKAAFSKLAMEFSGASTKDGKISIDAKRQETARNTYEAELSKVQELGLVNWYMEVTGKSKDKKVLTDAEKQAAASKRAYKVLEAIAKDDTDLEAQFKAECMLAYGQAASALYKKNPAQAKQMLEGDLSQLKASLTTAIDHLNAA